MRKRSTSIRMLHTLCYTMELTGQTRQTRHTHLQWVRGRGRIPTPSPTTTTVCVCVCVCVCVGVDVSANMYRYVCTTYERRY